MGKKSLRAGVDDKSGNAVMKPAIVNSVQRDFQDRQQDSSCWSLCVKWSPDELEVRGKQAFEEKVLAK